MSDVRDISGIKIECRPETTDYEIALDNIDKDEYNIRKLHRENGQFVDIGSYCGFCSLLAASLGMNCTAVEPLHENVKQIVRNFAINSFRKQIKVIQGGIGTDQIFWGDPTEGIKRHRFVANSSGSPLAKRVGIRKLDLDDELRHLEQIDIMKTDCEGGEWTLPQFKETIAKTVHIVGEFHTIDHRGFADFVALFDQTHQNVSGEYLPHSDKGLRLFVLRRKS